MSKYTPGPWRWVRDPRKIECEYTEGAMLKLVGQNDGEICNFGDDHQYYPTEGTEPDEADARLIAAAPELLEALKALLDMPAACYADIEVLENIRRREAALAVLAKAEGKDSE